MESLSGDRPLSSRPINAIFDSGQWRSFSEAPRPRQQAATMDQVLESLARLESSMDELRDRIAVLPSVLRGQPDKKDDLAMMPDDVSRKSLHRGASKAAAVVLRGDSTDSLRGMENPVVHEVLAECAQTMERSSYKQIEGMSLLKATGVPSGIEVKAGWTSSWKAGHPVIHPASRICSVLDILRVLFFVFDITFVPYSLSFDLDLKTSVFLYFSLVAFSFWSLDLVLNFFTGYVQAGGGVVMRWRSVAIMYLRTYFLIDLIVVVADGMHIAIVLHPDRRLSNGFAWRSIRILRFLRLARVLRVVISMYSGGLVARLRANFAFWICQHGMMDYVHHLNFTMTLLQVICVMAWFGHIGACIWNAVVHAEPSSGTSEPSEDFSQLPVYVQALYWAIGTMYSGSSILWPETTLRTLMAVLWVCLGAVFLTAVTSTLAAILIESGEKQKEMSKKHDAMASFMGQRQTPTFLAAAVQADLSEKLRSKQVLTEHDLPFLQVLELDLRADLREAHHGKSFTRHAFFRMLSILDTGIIKTLCSQASSAITVRKGGEEVLHPHQDMDHTILVSRGNMEYRLYRAFSEKDALAATSPRKKTIDVSEDNWICELALLMSWKTTGVLKAMGVCELMHVTADFFLRTVSDSPVLVAVVSSYAVQALKLMMQSPKLPTDVDIGLDFDAVVCNLHPSIRGPAISMPILSSLRRHPLMMLQLRRQKPFKDLHDEVVKGKCHLSISPDGDRYRVVRLVVIRLLNRDRQMCVLLAQRMSDGSCTAKLRLPGRKVEGGELPHEVVSKLLQDELAPFADRIQFSEEVETTVEFDDSWSFGLRTKYIKLVYTAHLEGYMVYGGRSNVNAGDQRNPVSSSLNPNSWRLRRMLPASSAFSPAASAPSSFSPAAWDLEAVADNHMQWLAASTTDAEAHPRAFAIDMQDKRVPHGMMDVADSTKSREVNSTCAIYKWVEVDEFQRLTDQRADVEKEIRSSLLPHSRLEQLADWSIRSHATTQVQSTNMEMAAVAGALSTPPYMSMREPTDEHWDLLI